MTEKIVRYTPEQTAEMIKAYEAEPTRATVEALAEKMGKSVKSVISKLSREKVYVKAEYVTKRGEKPVRKSELVEELAAFLGVASETLDSLEKASKPALQAIVDRIREDAQLIEKLADEATMAKGLALEDFDPLENVTE